MMPLLILLAVEMVCNIPLVEVPLTMAVAVAAVHGQQKVARVDWVAVAQVEV
jgi:hypothetical protein